LDPENSSSNVSGSNVSTSSALRTGNKMDHGIS
jgi:hypothetical protein